MAPVDRASSPDPQTDACMADSSLVPPASTFIVRFWRESSAAGSHWRGRIKHVQSGECATCLDLETILDFIQNLGVMTDHLGQRQRGEAHV